MYTHFGKAISLDIMCFCMLFSIIFVFLCKLHSCMWLFIYLFYTLLGWKTAFRNLEKLVLCCPYMEAEWKSHPPTSLLTTEVIRRVTRTGVEAPRPHLWFNTSHYFFHRGENPQNPFVWSLCYRVLSYTGRDSNLWAPQPMGSGFSWSTVARCEFSPKATQLGRVQLAVKLGRSSKSQESSSIVLSRKRPPLEDANSC